MLTRSHVVSFSCFVIAGLGWLGYLLATAGALPFVGGDGYKVSVLVPTSASLGTGSRVTMAGVYVGRIQDIKRQGIGARVDLEITDKGAYPLPTDSRVALRQHTAIGENYVSIIPGRSQRTVKAGGVLGLEQADEPVDVDQALSVLRGKTRERARQTIQGLGGAVAGHGRQLNETVHQINRFAPAVRDLVDIAHRDRLDAGRLVEQLGDVAAAVGDRGEAIRTIGQRGLVGLRAIRDRDAALAESLRRLPRTIVQVRDVTSTIGAVSDRATPVAASVALALRDLRPAIRNLPSATDAGRVALQYLQTDAPILENTFNRVTALSKTLPSTLPTATRTLCEVDPMVKYLAPYSDEAIGIITGLSSASNSYDATGHLIRLAPTVADSSSAGLPDEADRAKTTVLHSGIFGQVNGLSYVPYPKPGELGKASSTGTTPIGPEAVPDTGYKYPRIHSEC